MRPGFNPGAGRSPVEGHDNLLQYSCLENPLDRGAWWATVHRVTKSWTRVKQLAHTHTRPLIWNSVLYFALNPITFGPSSIPSLVSQVLVAWGVSVQFSGSVMSNSLWAHGLQHARLLFPSPTPGTYSNSCPLSQWCHPTISSSVVPFSRLQSVPASGSFQISQFFF